jgi:hypothetical protein
MATNEPSVGEVSHDGAFYWDGAKWNSTFSPDGAWKWSGAGWVPAQAVPGAGPAAQYESPTVLGIWVSVLIGLSGAIAVVEALFLTDFVVFTGQIGAHGFTYTVGVGGLLIYAVAGALFLIWFHRSHRNLVALGARDLKFSSFWAIGCWFVPVAAFWQPCRVTDEIWKASDAEAAPSSGSVSVTSGGPSNLVRAWWAAWLGSLLTYNIAAFAAADPTTVYWQSSLSAVASVVAAVLGILVVTSISARQDDRWRRLTATVPLHVTGHVG